MRWATHGGSVAKRAFDAVRSVVNRARLVWASRRVAFFSMTLGQKRNLPSSALFDPTTLLTQQAALSGTR
jgi:hypothetical protein